MSRCAPSELAAPATTGAAASGRCHAGAAERQQRRHGLAGSEGLTGLGDPPDWTECVSDAAGDCSFTFPSTQDGGINRDRRFWIVQRSSPDGYYHDPTLVPSQHHNRPRPFRRNALRVEERRERRDGQTYDILPVLSTMPTPASSRLRSRDRRHGRPLEAGGGIPSRRTTTSTSRRPARTQGAMLLDPRRR